MSDAELGSRGLEPSLRIHELMVRAAKHPYSPASDRMNALKSSRTWNRASWLMAHGSAVNLI